MSGRSTWKAGSELRLRICVQDLSVSHLGAGFGKFATVPRATPDNKKRHSTAPKHTTDLPHQMACRIQWLGHWLPI